MTSINGMKCSATSKMHLISLDLIFSARLSSTPEATVRTWSVLNRDKDHMSGTSYLLLFTQVTIQHYLVYMFVFIFNETCLFATALKRMKKHKAPGLSGLAAEMTQ